MSTNNYGVLNELLADKTITDILVNGKDRIYVDRGGMLSLSGKKFATDQELMDVIEKMVSHIGRRLDRENPMVDGRLPDGSRINVVIPPIALDGAMISIRKFSEKFSVERLIQSNTLNEPMKEFLKLCVLGKKNILVSGRTSSGKTTILNVLSSFIPATERIITIEDAAELQLHQEHVGRLETRHSDVDGKGEVTIRHLVINALRMRPDRIVVGECRGGESLDMLQAMNTGHDGSMTTIHANTSRDALKRLETSVLMAGIDLPTQAIRQQIVSAIHIIVQMDRLSDGSRKMVEITQVTGMEGNTITTAPIFQFKQTGLTPEGKVAGGFRPTGTVPTFLEELRAKGMKVGMEIFQ